MRHAFLAAIALLVAAAACSDDADTEIPSDLDDVVITMERTVCLGTCPAYELTIRGDGSVTYDGSRYVAVEGRQTSKISTEAVRQLVAEFYAIDFFSLRDRYECLVTDLPSAITSISIGGETKTVHDYGPGLRRDDFRDCAAPEELVDLEDKIDELTNSARWVGEGR